LRDQRWQPVDGAVVFKDSKRTDGTVTRRFSSST
jgi:hypothetical protein